MTNDIVMASWHHSSMHAHSTLNFEKSAIWKNRTVFACLKGLKKSLFAETFSNETGPQKEPAAVKREEKFSK